MGDMLRAALEYAERGLPVFPVWWINDTGECACGGVPGCTPGKHPINHNGLTGATCDPDQVRLWWSANPRANIGARVDPPWYVVDLDVPNGVDNWPFADAETKLAETGGGGFHLWFHTLDQNLPGAGSLVGADGTGLKIDVRGMGKGYVLMPPSNHISGCRYVWVNDESAADMPDEIGAWIKAHRRGVKRERTEGSGFNRSLKHMGEGSGRNNYLVSEAGKVWTASGGEVSTVRAHLESLNAQFGVPLPEGEIEAMLRQVEGWSYVSLGNRAADDTGLGEMFVEAHGTDFRWVREQNIWAVWEGSSWIFENSVRPVSMEARVRQLVLGLISRAYRDVEEADDGAAEARAKAQLNNLRAYKRHHSKLSGPMKIAQSVPGVSVDIAAFDSHDDALNCPNGVVELSSGRFYPHGAEIEGSGLTTRDLYLTKSTGVVWDPGAKCPRWERFLMEVCCGDLDLVHYLQRAVGYSLGGSIEEHALFFLYGHGSNGKSTFLNVVRQMLGSYATSTAPGFLQTNATRRMGEEVPLVGARFALCSELDERAPWDSPRVKSLTGGDVMQVNPKYRAAYTSRPTHKLWVAGNAKPIVLDSTDGLWRRLHLVPFHASFRGSRLDMQLPEKLRAELPGILRWAVEGHQNWREHGLESPRSMLSETQEYRDENDLLAEWRDDPRWGWDADPDSKQSRADIWWSYTTWANATSKPDKERLSTRRLYRELINRGLITYMQKGERGFKGIKLRQQRSYNAAK